MNFSDFNVTQLKTALRHFKLSSSGNKAELIARLQLVDPDGEQILRLIEIEGEDAQAFNQSEEESGNISQEQDLSQNFAREMDLLRRERDLARQELVLTQRENDVLRGMSQTAVVAHDQPNAIVKVIADLLSEFDGADHAYPVWEKQVKLLRNTYNLNDNTLRILIGLKLKGKALKWFHSKAEHVEMNCEELLKELKDMFDHRLSQLSLRKTFEGRIWKTAETFSDYYHEKMIMANRVPIDKEELVDYLLEGIPDIRLRDQARMQCFESPSKFLEAFRNITLRSDAKKLPSTLVKAEIQPGMQPTSGTASKIVRCYNCNSEGHVSAACLKPRREKGSCFTCGSMDHRNLNCPYKQSLTAKATNNQPKPVNGTTTALVEPPKETTMPVEPSACTTEQHKQDIRIPIAEPTRDYCVLVTRADESQYFVEALIDSGSAINLMTETTYLKFFNDCSLIKGIDDATYGGVNKSPLTIYGYITPEIRLKPLADHKFAIKFAVVPDSTMTYDALLGREFTSRPGMTVILGEILELRYNTVIKESNILQIEPMENSDCLDVVRDNLDESIPFEIRRKLLILLENYINAECEIYDADNKFEIQLMEGSKPFYCTPRRLSWSERNEVRRIITDLLKRRIIRPSNSNFSSPIVLTKKKDGTYRLCIDYRALNKITIKDRYPLPLIDDQIDCLSNSHYFTSLDLKDGFHHVLINENSIKFTSFVTPDGQYEYLKMPFGLCNAPAAFQRYVNAIFRPLLEEGKILLYLDDILIATKTINENLKILREVLDLMSKHKLELKFSKYHFKKKK